MTKSILRHARAAGLAIAVLASSAAVSMAQQVVGTSVVDGKKVELLSNNSWRFVGAQVAGCAGIAGDVTFCGDKSVWQPIPAPNAQIAAAYQRSERHYGVVISEGIGTNSGISVNAMRDVAIQNAANGAGIQPNQVAVTDAFISVANGVELSTVAYSVEINGIPIYYLNSIFVGPDRAIQLITYELDRNLTDLHRQLHQEFLDLTKVSR